MAETHTKVIANTGSGKVVIVELFKCILQKSNTSF